MWRQLTASIPKPYKKSLKKSCICYKKMSLSEYGIIKVVSKKHFIFVREFKNFLQDLHRRFLSKIIQNVNFVAYLHKISFCFFFQQQLVSQ